MKIFIRVTVICAVFSALLVSAQSNQANPRWWRKFNFLLNHGASPGIGPATSLAVGENVDVSNECGPQSETYITLDPNLPRTLAAGSNEIFRLPMRGYFSTDDGSSWGGVDLPLPPPLAPMASISGPTPRWPSTVAATCSTGTSWCSSAQDSVASTAPRWR